MVYAFSPQQRFEMYLGCHETSFQMVCRFWSPACSPAASADATLDWSSLETVCCSDAMVDQKGVWLICEMCQAGQEVSQCIWASFN